jgi:hypothetical protein
MMGDTEQIRDLFTGWEPTLDCEAPGHLTGVQGCKDGKAEHIVLSKHICKWLPVGSSYVICRDSAIWLQGRMNNTGMCCHCGYGGMVRDFFIISAIRGADDA